MYEQMEMFIGAVNYLEDDDIFTQHCKEAMVLVWDHGDSVLEKVDLYLMLKHIEKEVENDMDDDYNFARNGRTNMRDYFLMCCICITCMLKSYPTWVTV